MDSDVDGRLDNCPAGTPGDLNGDGAVNGQDLTLILSHWGLDWPTGDADGNGIIDGSDLLIVLAHWTF